MAGGCSDRRAALAGCGAPWLLIPAFDALNGEDKASGQLHTAHPATS